MAEVNMNAPYPDPQHQHPHPSILLDYYLYSLHSSRSGQSLLQAQVGKSLQTGSRFQLRWGTGRPGKVTLTHELDPHSSPADNCMRCMWGVHVWGLNEVYMMSMCGAWDKNETWNS